MLDKVVNVLTNPTLVSIAQSTKASVSIETGLKAAGRPMFTLADKNVDEKTRKYSATKEFVYQALCLLIYMGLIIPVFKKGTFGLFKKYFKGEKEFDLFKNASEYLKYHELATLSDKGSLMKNKAERFLKKALKFETKNPQKATELKTKAQELTEAGNSLRKTDIEQLPKHLQDELAKPHIEKFENAKGAIEASSVVGSVLGLTIIAPELSHIFLHPIMKAVGMEQKPEKQAEAKVVDANKNKLDKQA